MASARPLMELQGGWCSIFWPASFLRWELGESRQGRGAIPDLDVASLQNLAFTALVQLARLPQRFSGRPPRNTASTKYGHKIPTQVIQMDLIRPHVGSRINRIILRRKRMRSRGSRRLKDFSLSYWLIYRARTPKLSLRQQFTPLGLGADRAKRIWDALVQLPLYRCP